MLKLVNGKRVFIIFVLTLLILSLTGKANSAEIKFRLSHPAQPKTPVTESLETFKTIVEKESNGQLKIELFGSSVLGTEPEMAEQLALGTIDIAVLATTNFAPRSSSFLAFDLPFIFDNYAEWRYQMGGYKDGGGGLLRELREYVLKKDGVALLGCEAPGKPKSIGNTIRPLRTPDDSKGLKIRVSASPIEAGLIKEWGFIPIPIPWPEVYSALGQKIIDGTTTDYLVGGQYGQFEILKYVTETDATQSAYIILVNGNKWKSLTPDLQEVLLRAASIGTQMCWGKIEDVVEQYKQKYIRERHIEVYVPVGDIKAQWVKPAIEKVWPKFAPTTDQNVLKIVEKYRKEYQEYLKKK